MYLVRQQNNKGLVFVVNEYSQFWNEDIKIT